jgi:hypothetical protein
MSTEIPPQFSNNDLNVAANRDQAAGIGVLEIALSIAIMFAGTLIYAALYAAMMTGNARITYPLASHFFACAYIAVGGFSVGCSLAYAFRPVKSAHAVSTTPGEQLTLLLAILSVVDLAFRDLRMLIHAISSHSRGSGGSSFSDWGSVYAAISISQEALDAIIFLIALLVGQRPGWRLFSIANLFIAAYWVFDSLRLSFLQSFAMPQEFGFLQWLGYGFYIASIAATLCCIALLITTEKPAADANRPSLQRHFFGKTLWVVYLLLTLATPVWFYLASFLRR